MTECACKNHDICCGDTIGRGMFREYYDCWEIPVFDDVRLYCCGRCQNSDNYVVLCGDMYVCEKHMHLHDENKYEIIGAISD